MRVRVRFFAVAKQLAGLERLELELPEGSTIAQLRQQLAAAAPRLRAVLPQMSFALAAQYATEQTPVVPDVEVACIPPVSGG